MAKEMFDSISREVPISCEFPIENLPYTIEAHKIGDQMMLCFTGKENTHNEFGEVYREYFVISVRENNVHIGCPGG
jgi:hypothetical protein